MGCTVAELQGRMDSAEFTQWQAFDELEPFGSRMVDLAVGQLATLVANINRDPKRQPYALSDFLISRWDVAPPPSQEELDFNLRYIFEALCES